MEAVEVDAVPEARDTYHAACTERVAPRGEASAIDYRFVPLDSFVHPQRARQRQRVKLLRAELRVRGLRSKERAGNLNGSRQFYWWKEKIRPL